jgi:hypothetical protein
MICFLRVQEMGEMVRQHHRQHVAPNGRMLMVADIGKDTGLDVVVSFFNKWQLNTNSSCCFCSHSNVDGDGRNEVIVGFSDRKVQSYRWMQVSDTAGYFLHQETWQLAGQVRHTCCSIVHF